jgi:hypothetical protein
MSSGQDEDDLLGQKFGGYTVKQRLREEIESPFRNVRLLLFASSSGSALTALYFSSLAALKAFLGGYSDAPPLEESLQSCAINVGAAVICGLLALREYRVGEANLARIAKGGALARLAVTSAGDGRRSTLKEYRRKSRVLIAVGGDKYIKTLARSLNADQLADENTLPSFLEASDIVVVPVVLEEQGERLGNTMENWKSATPDEATDRNFDIDRANKVIAFPSGTNEWYKYLESEIETAKNQGFDVLDKGFTIVVKKNGRILRRATGQPQWNNLLNAMEVLDGSLFGMPGDSEKYGGP